MIDLITIKVKAGDGGKGSAAFRHEKFYPNGGPFGGDGGHGGNIYFEVDTNETTLSKLRFTRNVKAGNGGDGMTKKMHGKDGDDVTIKVPLGTMIRNKATGDLLADLTKPKQIVLIARGGKGGLGNVHFATSRNSAPDYAQPGQPGEVLELQIELRLLADAGLIGLPSVGKSTFLSVVTNAKPQIAAYHFTTLEPNIGVVTLPDERSFVLADMPGLIEGAGEGKGLGHEFLRHIRRCRVLIHVIDMNGEESEPWDAYEVINNELKTYDLDLENRPQIIVANKMDGEYAQDYLEEFKKRYPDLEIYETSTLMHKGLEPILYKAMELIEESRRQEEENTEKEEIVVYRYEPKQPVFKIVNLGNHRWKVESDRVDRLVDMVDFESEESVYEFAMLLRRMGIEDALRNEGCENGDQVIVGTYIMDFED